MSDAPTTAAPTAAETAPVVAAPTTAAPAPASAPAPADTPAATADGTAQPTADPAAPAPSPAEDKPADAPAAPESYADFAAPEGLAMDSALSDNLKAFAKEKGLSQEDAQKLADMGFSAVQKTQDAFKEQMEQINAKWIADTRADKEFGGDKLQENLAVAKRALDTFGSEELTKLLHESGLGNHPEIIRYNFRVAQAISQDRLVPGGLKPAAGQNAQGFFDKSGMNP
jgi:hypothetical protein